MVKTGKRRIIMEKSEEAEEAEEAEEDY